MPTPDILLVLGLFFLILAFPSVISAFAERRFPLVGLLLGIAGAGMCYYAHINFEGGYTLEEIPHAIIRVLALAIN